MVSTPVIPPAAPTVDPTAGRMTNAGFFFTRGHQHRLGDRSEVHHCIAGTGVMLMKHPEPRQIAAGDWAAGRGQAAADRAGGARLRPG